MSLIKVDNLRKEYTILIFKERRAVMKVVNFNAVKNRRYIYIPYIRSKNRNVDKN